MKTNIIHFHHFILSTVCLVLLNCFSIWAQNPCGNFAGEPQPELQFICSGENANGPAIQSIVGSNAKLYYYLNDGTLTNIFASNDTGVFPNDGSYTANVQLYITAVVGPVGPNGEPDLNDPCTDIQQTGSPIIFLQLITIDPELNCNNDSANVEYSISGGYPAVSNSTYTVQASVNNFSVVINNNSFPVPPSGGTYIVNVKDDIGCNISITQDYNCEPSDDSIDLALIKTLPNMQNTFAPGDTVIFSITINNNGATPIQQVDLVDYIPYGLILADQNWTPIGQNAQVSILLNPNLPQGSFFTFDIIFTVAPNAPNLATITNAAEITAIRLPNGEFLTNDDDSTFDSNPDNDLFIDNALEDPNDEDDHDKETISIQGCAGTAGFMSADTIYVCSGEEVTVTETDSNPVTGDVSTYFLYSNPNNLAGTIIATNPNGTFADPNDNCTTLFISYAFGPDDGTGLPDLNNSCTKILSGTPVQWAPPISINVSETCEAPEFKVNYRIEGGFTECNNSFYTVEGNPAPVMPGETVFISTVFNSGDTYTITVTDDKECKTSIERGPVDCEIDCNNEPGTMSSDPLIGCANTTLIAEQSSESTLNTTDVDIYILHDSPSGLGNIVAKNPTSGSFQDQGMYCTTLYISYVFGPDNDGDNEPDNLDPCTVVLDGTPVQWIPEVELTSTAACEMGQNEFIVSYTIGGGASTCNSDAVFSLSGSLPDANIIAGNYTDNSNPLPGGTSFSITVMDEFGCAETFESSAIDCTANLPFCGNTAGSMQPADNPNACANSSITAIQNGTMLQPDFVGTYYLHDNPGTALGNNVITSNALGTFSDPNMPCTTLYISYVFGPNDGSDNVTLNDSCTFVLAGTPVTWAEPLSIETDEICNNITGTYTINLTIGGGFPVCDNTFTYDIRGAINLDNQAAGDYSSMSLDGGTSYSITIEDDNNCLANFESEMIPCDIACNNSAGTVNTAQIICEGKEGNGAVPDAAISQGSSIVYVLHNGETMLDTIYAFNTNGLFSNDSTYPVNRQLYISPIVGPINNNESIPDTTNQCTVIGLPGTPIVFLTDISITTEIVSCDENTGTATINYIPNGGHPAYDSLLTYTITDSDDAIVQFGVTETFTTDDGNFRLTATDNLGCVSTVSGLTGCIKDTTACLNIVGSQPDGPLTICDGAEGIATADEMETVVQQGSLVYVLHNGDTTLEAIDINSNGIFENNGTYPTDIELYIAAIIAILNPDGTPDLTDECIEANLPGTPIMFLRPLSTKSNHVCNADGSAAITFTIEGGTGNYFITGDYSFDDVIENEMLSFTNPKDSTSYTLDIVDSNGCKTIIDETYEACVTSCANDAGVINSEPFYFCYEMDTSFVAQNADVQEGYTLTYVLHDGLNTVGNILAYNNEGIFLNDGSYTANVQYHIAPIVTRFVNGEPDWQDPCLSATAPGKPVLFFEPIIITDEVECSGSPPGSYYVNFSISGGAPAAGFVDQYTVSGALSASSITMMQEVSSNPQLNSDYFITVTDTAGCKASVFRNDIECDECPNFTASSIPNIFSPDYDSVNNIWTIPNLQACYPNNRVRISNRWGNVVWDKTSCEDNCWNGNAQNSEKPLPTGAYYYVIQLNGDNSNEDDILKGTITLLR